MKITIDESIIQRYNLTLEEAVALFLFSRRANIHNIMDSLVEKEVAERNLFDDGELVLNSRCREIVSSILIDSELTKPQLDRFDALASTLISIYKEYGFKGRKSGTTYPWCDSVAIISKKLKTAHKLEAFTDEQAIKATRAYIEAFNSDYKFMELLKYFIIKKDNNKDELRSSLLSGIANLGEEDETQTDWTATVH